MQVKDIMTRDVVTVNSGDTISKALTKMKSHSLHQIVVMDGNNLRGIINLKDIIAHETDPSKAKVENFIKSAGKLSCDDEVSEAAKKILISGNRALPVFNGGLSGILSETDLLDLADPKYKLENIMSKCDYITTKDNFGKIKKTMTEKNISRLPVVEKGKVIGIIDTLDLIDIILKGKQKLPAKGGKTKDRGVKEKMNIASASVVTFMRSPHILSKDKKLSEVSSILKTKEEVLVEHDGHVYIVTPKDVLETVVKKEEKGVYVQITGLHDEEDPMVLAKIDKETTDLAKKVGKMTNAESVVFHIEKHHKQGKNIKYSIRVRTLTSLGLIVAKSWGWDPVTVFQDLKRKILREVEKKYGKFRHHKREQKSKLLS